MNRRILAAALCTLTITATACTATITHTTADTLATRHTPTMPDTAATAATAAARVGDTIPITGTGSTAGTHVNVTLVKLDTTAKALDQYTGPDPGKTFYAAQFRITNTGTIDYNDAPDNDAVLIDNQGQHYSATINNGISSGPGFSSPLRVTPGQAALGWVVFQVPPGTVIAGVQYILSSGFSNGAQWVVP